ncbi:MAG: hypothetical protein WC552_07785 [Candidatus Omnitrophota bacterium]
MFSLSTTHDRNQLNIIFRDHFDIRQGEQFYAQLKEMVPQLQKGFRVLTDMSSLGRIDLEAKKFLKESMELLSRSGVSEVVRIIPDQSKDIGFNIMSLFHYPPGTRIHIYRSIQEANGHFSGKIPAADTCRREGEEIPEKAF